MKTHPIKIKEKIFETEDTVTLTLEIPDSIKDVFKYTPGQFVTLEIPLSGEKVRRSYSLSTTPEVDREIKITIKQIQNGKLSPHITKEIQKGSVINCSKPAGFFFRENKRAKDYIFWAAGSGITPLYSIIKHLILVRDNNSVLLVYGNRTEDSIIFKKELDDLEKNHSSRFRAIHLLSRPNSHWKGLSGRLDDEKAKNILEGISLENLRSSENYLCGPEGFMSSVRAALSEKGVSPEKIHQESFDLTPEPKLKEKSSDIEIGDAIQGKQSPETLKIRLDETDFEVSYKEGTILETLVEEGLNVPYSCMDGECMACLCKIKKGRVEQNDTGILSEENFKQKEFLACQARPLSKTTHIDFDNIS